jgi:DNA ligase (NAD+)
MANLISKFISLLSGSSTGAKQTFHPTETCPECGTRLMRDEGEVEEEWRCPNLDCPAQIRARIEHWCSPAAMDIPGGDAAFVATLVSKGLVRDVAELYRLRIAELAALPGMNADSAKQFFDAITASQKREAWRLLFGLSIPLVGEAESKSLCKQFGSVDGVFTASADRLRKADEISEAVARSVIHWHSDSVNRKLVKRLFKAGLNFKS